MNKNQTVEDLQLSSGQCEEKIRQVRDLRDKNNKELDALTKRLALAKSEAGKLANDVALGTGNAKELKEAESVVSDLASRIQILEATFSDLDQREKDFDFQRNVALVREIPQELSEMQSEMNEDNCKSSTV